MSKAIPSWVFLLILALLCFSSSGLPIASRQGVTKHLGIYRHLPLPLRPLSLSCLSSDGEKDLPLAKIKTALAKWNIEVPTDVLERLKAKKEWIRLTQRVIDMNEKIDLNDLYEIFNFDHHSSSAAELFTTLAANRRPLAVVHGHKQQGKSQFIFFLVKLLQELGEVVIYLDKSILPPPGTSTCETTITQFWDTSKFPEECRESLDTFLRTQDAADFFIFTKKLDNYAKGNHRIWFIVDEVVQFSETQFPIVLPEEQTPTPFYWIVTGSAGIGSWVDKRHLGKFVFDLPLFSPNETLDFATKLSSHLKPVLDLSQGIAGVPHEGLSEWLEERFGGVIGYTTELIFAIADKKPVSDYMFDLNARIGKIIRNTATKRGISEEQLAKRWLDDIKSSDNTWDSVRDAGLCGSSAPRGVIFTMMLKWLSTYYQKEDLLSLVRQFRSKFHKDSSLDGLLLELEVILKLKRGLQFEATLLELKDQNWVSQSSMLLPDNPDTPVGLLRYEEYEGDIEKVSESESRWYLVELRSGFDVIDVVLIDSRPTSFTIYGIQITRSTDPFKSHHTLETCPVDSKGKIEKLWQAVRNFFHVVTTPRTVFVMIAPKCERDKFKARAGHEGPYLFSPANRVFNYKPAAQRPSHPIGKRHTRAKRKK